MADDQEKTEDATSYKLDDARSKGDVPQSRDFANFVVFFGLVLAIYWSANHSFQQIIGLIKDSFELRSYSIDTPAEYLAFSSGIVQKILWILSPLFLSLMVFGVAAYMGQFGFLITTDKLTPDFGKINPAKGFARIFSKDTLVEFIKSSTKITVIGIILYFILRGEVERLTELGSLPLPQVFLYLISMISKVVFAILIFMAVLGISDFAYQKWSYAQKMKMSMQEVKDEYKQKDGDPQVRARIRQIARDRLRKKMMKAVPTADVVVTNPTHVAVALKYQRGLMRAPVVVAKGAGLIALRIKELAAKAQVPILEKKQLARFLYKNVEVGESIPENLYTAVAEVLAYVYRIKRQFAKTIKNNVMQRMAMK